MPIKSTTVTQAICVIMSVLFLSTECLMALVIPVPEKDELLENADMAIVCKISEKKGKYYAQVLEVVKGNMMLVGKSVNIFSPYPEINFPLANWQIQDIDNKVLLIGNWNKKENYLSLIYGTASYWPRGMPDSVSKIKTLKQAKEIIIEHSEKQLKK